jgi:hypothetical protein
VLKALAKDPAHRYQSAKELGVDLERLTAGVTPLAKPPRDPARTRLMAGCVAAVLLLATGGYFYRHRTPGITLIGSAAKKTRRSVAVLGFKNLGGRPEMAWMSCRECESHKRDGSGGTRTNVVIDRSPQLCGGDPGNAARNLNMDEYRDGPGKAVALASFQPRESRRSRMSTLRVGDAMYSNFLKGMAWIDQQNYQIVHLETDILKPVPAVRLMTEHQVLYCGPVQFEQKKLKLWLPLEAEIYLDMNGRHFHHRNTYGDYRVFSADWGLKPGDPR